LGSRRARSSFDPATVSCCDGLDGLTCGHYQSCVAASDSLFGGMCQDEAWFRVACGMTVAYRGTYAAQTAGEALVPDTLAHKCELRFDHGCGSILYGGAMTGERCGHV
jgi:hypothetical protein